MSAHSATWLSTRRFWLLALVAGAFVLGPQQARGYFYDRFNADSTHDPVGNGTIIKWRAGSTATIWTDATQTLTWHFNSFGFSHPTWPSTAAAGAAFENGYKTLQDTTGTVLKIVRSFDINTKPVRADTHLDNCFTFDETSSVVTGQDISGAFAVTWVVSVSGAMTDADVEMNGDTSSFPNWATTGPPAPGNSNDVETTAAHEQIHSIGGSHPIYFYAMVWPTGRLPEILQYDRCISPDDRNLIRTLYPAAGGFGTFTGNVALSGGGPARQAVIIATDAAGIPQATVVTDDVGNYSINVPAGTYTVTAHHHVNERYAADIDFSTSSGFTTCTTSPATAVAAGASVGLAALTATSGTPLMKLDSLALNQTPVSFNDTNVMFLAPGQTGTIQVKITGTVVTVVSAVGFPGCTDVTLNGAATVTGNVVSIPFNVSANAVPGVRNLTFTSNGERLFVPAYIEVLAAGTLQVAASPGNPNAGIVGFSATDVPLLGVALTADNVEDIRIQLLRFHISGSGTALPEVRLWYDNGTVGIRDGADVRLFSGNAYSNNINAGPPNETLLGTLNADVLFDNIALTVKAGTTVNLLLTANTPASGTGSYTASLDSSSITNLEPHGMFWGSYPTSVNNSIPLSVTGGTVTGGTMTMAALGLTGLQQLRGTAGTAIAIGGFTSEPAVTMVTLRGTPTSTTTNVGMDVEVRPVGTPFTGTPTGSTGMTFVASGTQVSVSATVVSGTAYHWQARPISPSLLPGPWVVFGGNSDGNPAAVDFSVDTSTTNAPTGLQQYLIDDTTIVPVGSTAPDSVRLSASATNSAGYPVRLEFQVVPTGSPFVANPPTPQLITGSLASGANGRVTYTATVSDDYQWEVRAISQFGSMSGWTVFNGGPGIHFHVNASIVARAGCAGRTTPDAADSWILWGAGGLALLVLSLAGPAARKFGGALLLVFCISAVARADEEAPLPLSVSEWSTFPSSREFEELSFTAPPTLQGKSRDSWFSVDAYLAMIFLPMNFQVTGTDLTNRVIKGIGTGAFGIEAMATLHPDWRVGLAVEGDFWSDMRILVGGVVGTWRFAYSRSNSPAGRPEIEHYAKIGGYYENLVVTKSNFGKFDWGFGARAGYEIRFSLSKNWSLLADAEVVYAKWRYAPAILAGNPSVGGIGGLISVGIVFYP